MTDLQFSTLITAIASSAGVLLGSGITLLYNLLHNRAEKKQRVFETKKATYENLVSAIKRWRGCQALQNNLIPFKGELKIDEAERYLREDVECSENVLVCLLQSKFIAIDPAQSAIDHFRNVFGAEPSGNPVSNAYCEAEERLFAALQVDLFNAKLPKPRKQKGSKK